MPRTEITERTLYTFAELDEAAQERAIDAHRDCHVDYGWWDHSYNDFAHVAGILGISLRQKPVKLVNGSTVYAPAIYFTGCCMKGGGASFEGDYTYAKGSAQRIRECAPHDQTLHTIADALQAIQSEASYQLTATITPGRADTMACDVSHRGEAATVEQANAVTRVMCNYARWMYRQLACEHDDLTSDESVIAAMEMSGLEFFGDGTPA